MYLWFAGGCLDKRGRCDGNVFLQRGGQSQEPGRVFTTGGEVIRGSLLFLRRRDAEPAETRGEFRAAQISIDK